MTKRMEIKDLQSSLSYCYNEMLEILESVDGFDEETSLKVVRVLLLIQLLVVKRMETSTPNIP